MKPYPLRRHLVCMSTRGMRHPTHCTRILNRVRTHGRLMFPHHPSRRPCLCLGGHPAQRSHRQNTQSDRTFISSDPHPYGVDTTPTVYGWLHPSVPHAPVVDMDVSSSRLPTSRRCCVDASLRFTVWWCVVCLLRVAWMEWHGCKTLGSDRGSFTPARRCVSYGP